MNARELLAAAHIGSGIRQGAMPPDEYVFVKDPPEIFCKADSSKSPREMHARAALIVAAVNEYEALLEVEDAFREFVETFNGHVDRDGRMTTAGAHAEDGVAILARLDAIRSPELSPDNAKDHPDSQQERPDGPDTKGL